MTKESLKGEVAITSFGGAGGSVTGSCHLLESGRNKVIVDMGQFLGRDDLTQMKNKNARGEEVLNKISEGNPPILITHGHIDHFGFLPAYFRRGHKPVVYATKETAQLMESSLYRSARAQRKFVFKNSVAFDSDDVANTINNIQIVEPFEEIPITKDKKISATFCLNGHTPDSTSILLKDRSTGKNILFTGDIGRPTQLVTGGYNRFSDRFPQDPINILVTESTCFPDTSIPFEERVAMFQREINTAFERGSPVLMPCIQHRYMENIEIINRSQKEGKLPKKIAFFRDGPALADISEIYKNYNPDCFTTSYGNNPDCYKPEDSKTRFRLENLQIIFDHEKSILFSRDLGKQKGKTIIFTSGGMGDDGRALNYLENSHYIKNSKNTVIFSCYQVPGTLGADLLQKQRDPCYRSARIVKLEGGSSHATGADEIFGFHQRFDLTELESVVIVHGENESRKLMEIELRKTVYGEHASIKLPDIGERVNLN